MSQWYVELTCKDTLLLAFLTTCLHEPSCTVIEKKSKRFYIIERDGQHLYRTSDLPTESESNRYYWLSSDFELYTNPNDVDICASQQLPLLNSILRLKYGFHISAIQTGDVYRADEQDRLIKHTVKFPPIEGRLVTSESKLQTANEQQPNIATLWRAERKHPEFEEAMRHFANQRNWFNLYKVYEVIEHVVGKDVINGWTEGRADDFTYSANNARVSGYDARHFSARFPKASAKRTPLSLWEADVFITNLLSQWLQTKAS